MWIFFNINFIAFEVQYKFFLTRRAETLFIYVIYFFTTTRIGQGRIYTCIRPWIY